MTANAKIKGIREVTAKFLNIKKVFRNRALFERVGAFMKFSIDKRTSAGEDVQGNDFKPYSPLYAMFRKKTGHSTSKVNLRYTGSMMSALTYEATPEGVRIYFMPTHDKKGVSNPMKAFFLNEEREFFGISKEEVELITAMVQKDFRQAMRK